MSVPRRVEPAAVVLLLLLGAAQLGVAALRDSSVGDEHPHILSGWLYLTSGRFSGGLDNPPLGQLWIAAPLVFLRLPYRFAADDALFASRAPVILCALALALVLWRWARAADGPRAGLLLLAMWNLEPNLLAHGHLATLDLPHAFAWWLALWCWRGLLRPERRGEVVPALLFGAAFATAVLVKFTGFLLWPAALATAILVARRSESRRRAALALVLAPPLLFVAAHVAYAFEPTHFGWPEHLWNAIRGKAVHREEVRFAYLAGRRSENGFLVYYLVALLLKTPLPLLLLAPFGLRRGRGLDVALWVVPASLVVVAFSLVRVNIGVRHVLPVIPALLLAAASGGAWLLRSGRWPRAALAAAGALWLAGHARTAPEYLPYFNVLAGGAAGGHRWLLDSNLDWGQDDGRLATFLDGATASWEVNPAPQPARAGRFAVSSNALHNLQRRDATPYDWLRGFAPTGFAGRSWRLYALAPSDFEARAAASPDDVLAQIAWAEVQGDAAAFERLYAVLGAEPRLAARAARASIGRGDLESAATWVRRGLAARADDTTLRVLDERLRLEAAARATPPEEAALARLDLALFRAEVGELDSVRAEIAALARALPQDARSQRAWGVAQARGGDFESAFRSMAQSHVAHELAEEIETCRRLAESARRLGGGSTVSVEGLHELGRAQFEAERHAEAARAFGRILELDPTDGMALAYLGEMQVRSKLRVTAERLPPLAIRPARRP